MAAVSSGTSCLKLSICITTLNRGAFIGATLDSMLSQLTDECEVVVLDAASTDDTEILLTAYASRCNRLRYVRQLINNGLDRDYDRVVELASGQYVWLMTDDDFLTPGAVTAVLSRLREGVSLVVANAEVRDLHMSRVLQPRCLPFDSDRQYGPDEMDRLFVEVGDILKYIGSVVIKREIWLVRHKERYYGSLFIHLGVIFQEPLPGLAIALADPVISYRLGNVKTFSAKMFETMFVKWPSVVASLPLTETAKAKLGSAEPWRDYRELVRRRAMGQYSLAEYQRWIRPQVRSMSMRAILLLIALFPGTLANAFFVAYYRATRRSYRDVWAPELELQSLRESRYNFRNLNSFMRSPRSS